MLSLKIEDDKFLEVGGLELILKYWHVMHAVTRQQENHDTDVELVISLQNPLRYIARPMLEI